MSEVSACKNHSIGKGQAQTSEDLAGPLTKQMIWLVQHAGFPGEGGKAQGVFKQAAIDTFTEQSE